MNNCDCSYLSLTLPNSVLFYRRRARYNLGILAAARTLSKQLSTINTRSVKGRVYFRISGILGILKTYEKVAVLSGTGVPSSYVERAFYYDQLGRLIQTVESNAMGTVSRYSSGYDFLGNVTASREQHGSDYKTSTFTYDLRGRLLSESTSVNGSVTATMAYAYDPLGRLKTTTSGSGTNAVTTTDTLNIQGWLTSRTAMKGTGGSASNIFSMSVASQFVCLK